MIKKTEIAFALILLLGVLLYNPPLLHIFNKLYLINGLPLLYIYLFIGWLVIIGLIAYLSRRIPHDPSDE